MKFKNILISAFFVLLLFGCIGEDIIEDFVNPELRIENPLESLGLNQSYQFEGKYLNNIGQPENVAIIWSSSDGSVVSIDQNTGLATALQSGQVTILATANAINSVTSSTTVRVADQTIAENMSRTSSISSAGGYRLEGDFILENTSPGSLRLSFSENYEASTSLPGLYVYLTNNPNSINGAYEIGKVAVFKGAHAYNLPENITITDYNYLLYWCKPFSVNVGGGTIN